MRLDPEEIKEREAMILAYEAEEERLVNGFGRKLEEVSERPVLERVAALPEGKVSSCKEALLMSRTGLNEGSSGTGRER
jgi:hypothetical protein